MIQGGNRYFRSSYTWLSLTEKTVRLKDGQRLHVSPAPLVRKVHDIFRGSRYPGRRTVRHTPAESGQVQHAWMVRVHHRPVSPLESVTFEAVPGQAAVDAAEGRTVESVDINGGGAGRVNCGCVDMGIYPENLPPGIAPSSVRKSPPDLS